MAQIMSKNFIASLIISGILLLSGCGILANPSQPGLANHYHKSTNKYLKDASQASNHTERNEHLLEAAGRALQDNQTQEAEAILANINPEALPTTLHDQKFLLNARVAINMQDGNKALIMLNQIPNPEALPQQQAIAYYQSSAMAHHQVGEIFMGAQDLMNLDPHLQNNKDKHKNRLDILNMLQQLPDSVMEKYEVQASYGILGGWMEIAYITKNYQGEQTVFNHELELWRQRYPGHPANELYPNKQTKTKWQLNTKVAPCDTASL